MSNVQTIKLPSPKAGVYTVQIPIPNGQPITLIIEVPECSDNKIVGKPVALGGLGVLNDCTSYTNLVNDEQRERLHREALVPRPKGQTDGYSDMEHFANNVGGRENPNNTREKLMKARGY